MRGFLSFDFAVGLFIFITIISFCIYIEYSLVKEKIEEKKKDVRELEKWEKELNSKNKAFFIIPKGEKGKCYKVKIPLEKVRYIENIKVTQNNKEICYEIEKGFLTIYFENLTNIKVIENGYGKKLCRIKGCKEIKYKISFPLFE